MTRLSATYSGELLSTKCSLDQGRPSAAKPQPERKGHTLCVAIVAATPSLSPKLGIWAMLGAALLSGPLGLGLLALVQWFGTQAAYLLEPIINR